ncbi:MAG: hypothetical protein EB150_03560 [Nitrososphaeria archaeon]|nr:hypothetical protein [Nitrososphaeria archaeon]NDB51283.1 hypothetical protein [Nitrosopumilaceae archaeon]NDB88091.1 hypothetical protein [Nitrososphaerota archaeon]NDB89825.1 hypothetical protein [Nitrososphaerota archaeon]NDF26234.1 hypothetical protein [Nitrosopumilaceae archaeon]
MHTVLVLQYPDTIVATTVEDKVAKKLFKHIESFGLECKLIPDGMMDFEYDYPRSSLDGPAPGIASRGVIKVTGDIDYIDLLKRKTVTKSEFAPGGMYGMGVAEGTTWKLRFFLSFPSEYELGPLNFGTLTKVLKGRLHSKVDDFIWSGYGKLTTLPPGLVADDVIGVLNADKKLHDLMMHALLKEQVITVSTYAPKAKVNYDISQIVKDDSYWYKYKPKKESHAKLVITSEWKSQKDIMLDREILEAYSRIATNLKGIVEKLRYHLIKKD